MTPRVWSHRRACWGAFAAALGSLSICVEQSRAAAGWVAPVDISAAGVAAGRPQIALDGQGDAVAVWRRNLDGGQVVVQSAVRPAGENWQAPVDVSSPGLDGGAPGPQVAVNAAGTAVAVWQRFNGTSLVVQAAERPAGGSWSAPVDVSAAGAAGDDAANPRVAIGPQGNVMVVWQRVDATKLVSRLESAERPAGGTWQPFVALSPAGDSAIRAVVAIDAQGTAYAAWVRPGRLAQSAVHPAGGAWQAPEDIPGSVITFSAGTYGAAEVDLAVDAAGDAVAAWTLRDLGGIDTTASVRPAGGSWQAPVALGPFGDSVKIATDQHGNAAAVWVAQEDGTIVGAVRPAGAGWQPSVALSPPKPAGSGVRLVSDPVVAVDAHGEAIAAWTDSSGPRSAVVVRRHSGGAWQAPRTLSSDAGSAVEARLAVDPNGNALAAWADGVAGRISAAGFDATAPELRSISIPDSGAAGRAVTFSASPFDVWSATSPVRWDFGDGATASGAALRHTYTALGSHTVVVSTTDAFGNPASTTRAIVIKPAVLKLRVAPSAFRLRRPGTVRFSLAAASDVRFVVERMRIGRRVGTRCVALTHRNVRRAPCTRYLRVGAFARNRSVGDHRFKVPARVGVRRLSPGRYRLSGTPRAAGLRGRPSRTTFRVAG